MATAAGSRCRSRQSSEEICHARPLLRALAAKLAPTALALLVSVPASAEIINVSDAPAYPLLYSPVVEETRAEAPGVVLLAPDLVEIVVALGAADRILARPEDVELPGLEATPHKVREWAGVEGVLSMGPSWSWART